MSASKKLVLIDGHAIMHRAYHALPNTLTTKDGEPINAVYGFVSMFLRIIQDLEPTHIAVCFDREEPTFRKEEFEEYQAHRPEMDEELEEQIDKVKDTVSAFGVPIYERPGFEADDLIGTLAWKAASHTGKNRKNAKSTQDKTGEFNEVIIVTGDRDILQLVNDKVKVYLPQRGLSNGKSYGKKEVEEKLHVKPEQIVDYKGLAGDPSDNYKGVPGIGPKTAQKLLKKHGSFEEIYKNLDKISDRTRELLEENRESAETSFMLAKIVTDVEDVELREDEMARWSVDNEKVLELFAKYGFKTLTNRVKEVGAEISGKGQNSLFSSK